LYGRTGRLLSAAYSFFPHCAESAEAGLLKAALRRLLLGKLGGAEQLCGIRVCMRSGVCWFYSRCCSKCAWGVARMRVQLSWCLVVWLHTLVEPPTQAHQAASVLFLLKSLTAVRSGKQQVTTCFDHVTCSCNQQAACVSAVSAWQRLLYACSPYSISCIVQPIVVVG
jgi:hypothetical protein